MLKLLPILAAALLCAAVPAQFASVTTFGTACTASGLTLPTIGYNGLPQLGTTFQITYTGPNRATWPTEIRPVLLIGFTQINFPVPLISNSQPTGCTIYVTPDSVNIMGFGPGISFLSTLDVPIPLNYSLIGFQAYAQWVAVNQTCLVTGCNMNAALPSDALHCTLGL